MTLLKTKQKKPTMITSVLPENLYSDHLKVLNFLFIDISFPFYVVSKKTDEF